MIEFYPEIRLTHIIAVLASGTLFLLRGLAVNLGQQWAMAAPLRYLSYTVDTVLLTAALMLATILHQYPFVHGWLTAKVLGLAAYIALGMLALRPRRPKAARVSAWIAAQIAFAYIVMVALTKNPLVFG